MKGSRRFGVAPLVAGLLLASAAHADEINLESGFSENDVITSVVTLTNTVTFSIVVGTGGVHSPTIARHGAPLTAFAVNDLSADPSRTGLYFLTDERDSSGPPLQVGDYRLQFANPVFSLSLDTIDFVELGTGTITLSVFSGGDFDGFQQDVTITPVTTPQGAVQALSFPGLPGFEILSAILHTSTNDAGSAIDNIRFENVRPVPEPATLTLLGIGIAGLLGYKLRRRA